MRILFAQLCKLYTVFLIVNATILVLGAPLETSVTSLNPLQKRLTFPVCPDDYPVYVESVCESMYSILVICNDTANPPDENFYHYPCQPRETCVQFYVNAPNPNQDPVPHAYCVANEDCKEWDNGYNDPRAQKCSVPDGYKSGPDPVDIEIAIIVYAPNQVPVQVNTLDAFYKGQFVDEAFNSNNFTAKISGYKQGELIQYCFNSGSDTIVTAYAAAQKISLLSDSGSGEFLEPL